MESGTGRRAQAAFGAAAIGASLLAFVSPAAAADGQLTTVNQTPFPSSAVIAGASWTTERYGPPANQFGDILATSSADSKSLYVLINDGGTGTKQPARWRNSFARVTGSPGNLQFTAVGDPGDAKTYPQVNWDEDQLDGALGSYYANGFTIAHGVFYATQVKNYNWNGNALFNGLTGIAYSTDQGKQWRSPKRPFPGPTGNLNFIQYGDNATGPDDYVYAIATEREFNASRLILGRARARVADVTNPARWQWFAGSRTAGEQTKVSWTGSITSAKPVLTWNDHITYPRMTYDAKLRQYLLTFSYSYTNTTPGVWKDGSELVIMDAPTPEGPFSFVADQAYFGPSNGYDPAFPVNWISSDGTDLWMIWAANFAGCSSGRDCSGAYGFNYRRIHLELTSKLPAYRLHDRRRPGRHRRDPLYVTIPQSPRPRWHDGPLDPPAG